MRSLLAMAVLLGICAACSNKPAATAAPPPATDPTPAASVPAQPTPATAPNATFNAGARPVYSPTTNPGYVVLNSDPPFQIPVSR